MCSIHLILALLLCSNCLNEAQTSKSLYEGTPSPTKEVQPMAKINQTNTKFTDLIEDILVLIIDEIPKLVDWLNFAESDPRITFLVGEAIRRKYSHYEIEFLFAHDDDNTQIKINISPFEKRIQITNFRLSLIMLKCFGRAMKRLIISNQCIHESRANRSTIINSLANEYASESLTYLRLGVIKKDTLAQFKKPFAAVEILDFVIATEQIGTILPFSQLFPSVQSLTVTLSDNLDYSFIDCELSHLEYLSINIVSKVVKKPNAQIEGLIRKNPQIKKFEFSFFPDDYISTVNKLLPRLESLSLNTFVVNEDILHFDHVKHLAISAHNDVPIDKLSFLRLESAKIAFPLEHSQACKQFFRSHENLTKLHLKVSRITDAHFEELLAELPHLIELTIECDYINTDAVVRFVETHVKLMKFEFAFRRYQESDLIIIRDRFQNEWNMQDHNHMWCGLLLEKRNSTLLQ